MRSVLRSPTVRACSCESGLVASVWIELDDERPASSRCQCHPNTESFPQTPAGFSAERYSQSCHLQADDGAMTKFPRVMRDKLLAVIAKDPESTR